MQEQNLRALQRFHFFPAMFVRGAQVSDRSAKKPRRRGFLRCLMMAMVNPRCGGTILTAESRRRPQPRNSRCQRPCSDAREGLSARGSLISINRSIDVRPGRLGRVPLACSASAASGSPSSQTPGKKATRKVRNRAARRKSRPPGVNADNGARARAGTFASSSRSLSQRLRA